MENGTNGERVPLTEDTKVKVLFETEASIGPDDKTDYPPAGSNSIYSAILSRNEAVKDAKRLKTFLELRDKYVKKKVVFEDPLFPANDSSLFYSHKPTMKIEWKRPSVSAHHQSLNHLSEPTLETKWLLFLSFSPQHNGRNVKLIRQHVYGCIALSCHLLQSQTADSHTDGCTLPGQATQSQPNVYS